MCRLTHRYRQQAGSYRESVYKSGNEATRKPKSQVGYQAASAAVAVVAPREAEWRFCAVGNPAWMPG